MTSSAMKHSSLRLIRLTKVAAAIELGIVGWLCATEGVGLAGWAVTIVIGGALLVFAIVAIGSVGGFALLAISSVMPRITWEVGNYHIHPEYVATALVIFVVGAKRLAGRGVKFQIIPADLPLLAYAVVSLLVSTFMSPEPSRTLRWAALSVIALLPYFILRHLITEYKEVVRCWRLLVTIGIMESLFGVLCFLSNRLFGTQIGVEADQYGAIPGTFGTHFEANLFGAYSACCAVMCASAYLFDDHARRRLYAGGFLIASLATVISLSRAPILALLIMLGFVMWVARKKVRVSFGTAVKWAVVVCTLAAVLSRVVYPLLEARFSTLDMSDLLSDETTMSRFIQDAAAIEGIRSHPLLGTGTSSLQLFFDLSDVYGSQAADTAGRGAWVGNTTIRVLHDTGILGSLTLLAFFVILIASMLKQAHRSEGTQLAMLTSLALGFFVYVITFQATDGTMLSFFWVHLGLCGCTLTASKAPNRA